MAKLVLSGFEELTKTLRDITPKEAGNLARVVANDIASKIAKEIERATPALTGTLKSSVIYKRSRPRNHRYISVVRLTAIKISNESSADSSPFYWKFIEFGSRRQQARPFVLPIKQRYDREMESIMSKSFGKKLEQLLARKAKKNQTKK